MFTGIVEEVGRVRSVDPAGAGVRIAVAAHAVLTDAAPGASLAVQGCCLTVVEQGDGWCAFDVQAETLGRSTLGALRPGDRVNLERPVRLADRLGGHLVQGHVDGVGTVAAVEHEPGGARRLHITAPDAVTRYLVEKGSVAVDGVSLTVAAVGPGGFDVALIPHTLAATTLGDAAVGTRVNLEGDVLAKYVERLLAERAISAPGGPR